MKPKQSNKPGSVQLLRTAQAPLHIGRSLGGHTGCPSLVRPSFRASQSAFVAALFYSRSSLQHKPDVPDLAK